MTNAHQKTLQKLEEQQRAIADQMAELKAKMEAESKDGSYRWMPEERAAYYLATPTTYSSRACVTHVAGIPQWMAAHGLLFRTEEQAETYEKIVKRAIELKGDWKEDWDDTEQDKCCIEWNFHNDRPSYECANMYKAQGPFYMPLDACRQLMREFGQDLKLFCGIVE